MVYIQIYWSSRPEKICPEFAQSVPGLTRSVVVQFVAQSALSLRFTLFWRVTEQLIGKILRDKEG